MSQDIHEFWNSRARLGAAAGSQDVVAKQLEIEAIAAHVRDGMRVLDVGCGNGVTAFELASRFDIDLLGVDFAEEMVAAAREAAATETLKGRVRFDVCDVANVAGLGETFDLIYSERMIINLQDWAAQERAIADITSLLKPGGLYAMCENSQEGLDSINALRARVDLPEIKSPWHNRYLKDDEIAAARIPGVALEGVEHFSATYYFLSRVVNAALAAEEGREPSYDAPVNRLALRLPPIGPVGQGRLWLWRRGGAA